MLWGAVRRKGSGGALVGGTTFGLDHDHCKAAQSLKHSANQATQRLVHWVSREAWRSMFTEFMARAGKKQRASANRETSLATAILVGVGCPFLVVDSFSSVLLSSPLAWSKVKQQCRRLPPVLVRTSAPHAEEGAASGVPDIVALVTDLGAEKAAALVPQ